MRLFLALLVLHLLPACSCGENAGNAGFAPPACERCGLPDGPCVDLASDPAHCGTCGVACGEGQLCSNRACLRRCEGEASFVATPAPQPIYGFDEEGHGTGPDGNGFAPRSHAFADVDGDGRTDLIVPRWRGTGIVVYPGTAAGGFGPGVESLADHVLRNDVLASGRLGPDDALRLVASSDEEGTLLFAPSGGLAFRFRASIGDARPATDVRTGDFDGDGDLDLLVAKSGGWPFLRQLFRNLGDDRFEPAGGTDLDGAVLLVADLDFDGRDDFAASDGTGLLVARSDGSGGFLDPVRVFSAPEAGVPAVADVDGDGADELLWLVDRPAEPAWSRFHLQVHAASVAAGWGLRDDAIVESGGPLAASDLDGDSQSKPRPVAGPTWMPASMAWCIAARVRGGTASSPHGSSVRSMSARMSLIF